MKRNPFQILDGALNELRELDDFLNFCESSIRNMEGAEDLQVATLKVMKQFGPKEVDEQREARRENARKAAQRSTARAKQEIAAGCPYLFRLGIIWLWANLEAAFDDLAVAFMLHENRWLKMESLRKLKGSFVEFASASEEQQGELLLEALKVQIAAPLKVGAGRFEEVFNLIGLGGGLDPGVARLMVEFSATRNVLVHRRGIIDKNFLRLCPWSKERLGAAIHISRDKYAAFSAAQSWYQLEMICRLTEFTTDDDGAPATPEARETAVRNLKEIQATYEDVVAKAIQVLEGTVVTS